MEEEEETEVVVAVEEMEVESFQHILQIRHVQVVSLFQALFFSLWVAQLSLAAFWIDNNSAR